MAAACCATMRCWPSSAPPPASCATSRICFRFPELLDRLDWVFFGGVDRELGAELACEVELLIDHVDRDDPPSGDRRVLDREVSQAADAEHCPEIGRAGARDLDRFEIGRAHV